MSLSIRLFWLFAGLCLGCAAVPASAQTAPAEAQNGSASAEKPAAVQPAGGLFPASDALEFSLVERSDFSLFIDGSYSGHIYREARSQLDSSEDGYSGQCYVLEESIRDARLESRKVAESFRLDFQRGKTEEEETPKPRPVLSPGAGCLPVGGNPPFPRYRGLLAGAPLRIQDLAPGFVWNARGSFMVDPKDLGGEAADAAPIVLPFYAEYRAEKGIEYQGRKLKTIRCRFALHYRAPKPETGAAADPGASPAAARGLTALDGKHELVLNIDAQSGDLVFLRDSFDDAYSYAALPGRRQRGFTLVFLNAKAGAAGVPAPGPETGAPAPESAAASAAPQPLTAGLPPPAVPELGRAGVELVHKEHNYVLLVRELPFVADSAEIIASEEWRLDAIAAELKKLPESAAFLVEGHSASTGRPEGEMLLSEQRAKKIADGLSARGIAASRFIYRGLGSTVPIASNADEAGRARNRRVEITILDF